MQAQAARVDLRIDSRLQFEFALGKAFEDQRILPPPSSTMRGANHCGAAMVR